jgi:hypothetical protein
MAKDYNRSLEPLYNIISIVAGYIASDQSFDGVATTYFGFLDIEGSWYIQKQVVTGNDIAWTYARGSGAYATSWAARDGLTYRLFNAIW